MHPLQHSGTIPPAALMVQRFFFLCQFIYKLSLQLQGFFFEFFSLAWCDIGTVLWISQGFAWKCQEQPVGKVKAWEHYLISQHHGAGRGFLAFCGLLPEGIRIPSTPEDQDPPPVLVFLELG